VPRVAAADLGLEQLNQDLNPEIRRNLAAYLLFFANRIGVFSFSAQILNCERACANFVQ